MAFFHKKRVTETVKTPEMKYVAVAYEPGEAMPYFEQASYFQVNILYRADPDRSS